MKIHLSKPGGQREGPFTVEQINCDLAAKKYQDTDYWAWHEGLSDWVPLHSVPGVSIGAGSTGAMGATGGRVDLKGGGDTVVLEHPSVPSSTTFSTARGNEPARQADAGDTLVLEPEPMPTPETLVSAQPAPELEEIPPSLQQQLFSGMPFSALEHLFILTTGEGQAGSHSEVTRGMLEAVTGEELGTVRHHVPRHVITQCSFLEKLRGGGAIPEAACRAVARFNPEIVQQAREGLYRICVRSFPIETGDMVTLFLFYRKQEQSN